MRTKNSKEPKQRASNITQGHIETVVSIIDNWGGKLTWPLLIASIERQLHQAYTRQALFAHKQITVAFSAKKTLLNGQPRKRERNVSPELHAALAKLASRDATLARQDTIIRMLTEQSVRFIYNASTANFTMEFLDRPLPPVDRGQTYSEKSQRKSQSKSRQR
jgi:hypothetical protein